MALLKIEFATASELDRYLDDIRSSLGWSLQGGQAPQMQGSGSLCIRINGVEISPSIPFSFRREAGNQPTVQFDLGVVNGAEEAQARTELTQLAMSRSTTSIS